jgi:hypothetical protein
MLGRFSQPRVGSPSWFIPHLLNLKTLLLFIEAFEPGDWSAIMGILENISSKQLRELTISGCTMGYRSLRTAVQPFEGSLEALTLINVKLHDLSEFIRYVTSPPACRKSLCPET